MDQISVKASYGLQGVNQDSGSFLVSREACEPGLAATRLSKLPNRGSELDPGELRRVCEAIQKMWGGAKNKDFENGQCLEWGVAVLGCLQDFSLVFLLELPAGIAAPGSRVKSHLLLEKWGFLFDHEGLHDFRRWAWDSERTFVIRMTPEMVRALTHGMSLQLPDCPFVQRDLPFDENLAGSIAQEFLRHYQPPVLLRELQAGFCAPLSDT